MARDKPDMAKAEAARREHRENLLDEALAESFPASDPPSIQVSRPSPKKARKPETK